MKYFLLNHLLKKDLTLLFKDPKLIVDLNDNVLKENTVKTKVLRFKFISNLDKNGAEGAGSVSLYAMLPSMGLSLSLSLILYFILILTLKSNTPIEGMWATVSVLQMMSYLTLMNLQFPQNLLAFLECIESVHDFNKWFPNPFTYLFPDSKLNMSPYNEQFESRGFKNRNMLYLCGSDLSMMLITILAIGVLIPLANIVPYFNTSLKKSRIAGTLLEKLRYSSVTRSFIQAYLKICLSACVNIGIVFFVWSYIKN